LPDLPVSRRSGPEHAEDVVLGAYLDLFERAKAQEDLQKMAEYAAAIDERQRFLERQARAKRARAVQLGRYGEIEPENDGAEPQERQAAQIPAIDITNLAPHADTIADAIMDAFGDMIPGPFKGTARSTIMNAIQKHPDAIKKFMDKMMSLMGTGSQGSTGSPGGAPSPGGMRFVIAGTNFDPYHPETWAKQLAPEVLEN